MLLSAAEGKWKTPFKFRRNRRGGLREGVTLISFLSVKSANDLVGHEWAEWYRLTPIQCWQE